MNGNGNFRSRPREIFGGPGTAISYGIGDKYAWTLRKASTFGMPIIKVKIEISYWVSHLPTQVAQKNWNAYLIAFLV